MTADNCQTCGHGRMAHLVEVPVKGRSACLRIGCPCETFVPVAAPDDEWAEDRAGHAWDAAREAAPDDLRAYPTITSAEGVSRARHDMDRAEVEAKYRPAAPAPARVDTLDANVSAQRDGHAVTPEAAQAEAIDVAHIERQIAWSLETFGPGDRLDGVLAHIRKELDEVADNPEDVTEWADVLILALDGAWRAGHTPASIIAAVHAKQAINEAREWPDWRTAPEGQPIEHITDRLTGRGHR